MKTISLALGDLCISSADDLLIESGPVAGGLLVFVYTQDLPKAWGVFYTVLTHPPTVAFETLKKPALFLPQAFEMLITRLKEMGTKNLKIKACGAAKLLTEFSPLTSSSLIEELAHLAQSSTGVSIEKIWEAPALIRSVQINTTSHSLLIKTDDAEITI